MLNHRYRVKTRKKFAEDKPRAKSGGTLKHNAKVSPAEVYFFLLGSSAGLLELIFNGAIQWI